MSVRVYNGCSGAASPGPSTTTPAAARASCLGAGARHSTLYHVPRSGLGVVRRPKEEGGQIEPNEGFGTVQLLNLTLPAHRQRRRRRPAHQKVHYLAMENDQVRCISCMRIGARGSDCWLKLFQGILVDLYVPRKCAATSEHSNLLQTT